MGYEVIKKKIDTIVGTLALQSRLYGRNDVFILVLLTFFSVLDLKFSGRIIRGWLDVLLNGESRSTKSAPATFIWKMLRRGAYSDGKCTYAGLVGGVDKQRNSNTAKLGLFPLAHRKAVIIDEANDIPTEVWGMLSGVRSRGVASITAIQTIETLAKCRKVWIANPRTYGEAKIIRLSHKGDPVNLIKDLIPTLEDLNRFDLILAFKETPIEAAQAARLNAEESKQVNDAYLVLQEALSQQLRFVWGCSADDISFTQEAEDLCYSEGTRLAKQYRSDFPGVLAAEQPDRMARLASAVAALVPQENDIYDGKIVVRAEHVEYVTYWIEYLFANNDLQYGKYAAKFKRTEDFLQVNQGKVIEVLKKIGKSGVLPYVYKQSFLTQDDFRKDNPTFTNVGGLFKWLSDCFLIHKCKGGYVKNDLFISLLDEHFQEELNTVGVPDFDCNSFA